MEAGFKWIYAIYEQGVGGASDRSLLNVRAPASLATTVGWIWFCDACLVSIEQLFGFVLGEGEMLLETTKSIVRKKLEEYEGNVPHMYLDSKGYVTIGVGHLIVSSSAAEKLPFVVAATGKKATTKEISDEYEKIRKEPKNRLASFYKKSTKLKLSKSYIDKLTNKQIVDFYGDLRNVYPDFDKYPEDVKIALFDMIFNLGMAKLKTAWPSFNKYIKAKEWGKAAAQSRRSSPVSAARNGYVKGLLEKASKLNEKGK